MFICCLFNCSCFMVDGISKIDKHLSIFEWGVMLELLAFWGGIWGEHAPPPRWRGEG